MSRLGPAPTSHEWVRVPIGRCSISFIKHSLEAGPAEATTEQWSGRGDVQPWWSQATCPDWPWSSRLRVLSEGGGGGRAVKGVEAGFSPKLQNH